MLVTALAAGIDCYLIGSLINERHYRGIEALSPKTARPRYNVNESPNAHNKQNKINCTVNVGYCVEEHHSALKDRMKSSVFSCRLKTGSDVCMVSDGGKLFHVRAAATGNARSPIVE